MSLELMIRPADVTIPQAIDNFEQLKSELEPKMQHYASLVVTEDGIRAAKKDKAELNKLKAAIDDQRKSVKNQCLALQANFESQCKELTAMIDKPIAAIDKQVKSFEEQQKQQKYDELAVHFAEVNKLPFLKLEDVLDPKWANATAKLDKLCEGITQGVERIYADYTEINELYKDSQLLTAILDRFVEAKDKGAALAYAAVLEKKEQQRREQEAQRVELERIRQEKEAAQQEEKLVEKAYTVPPEAVEKVIEQPEPKLGGCFVIKCTKAQLVSLRQHMENIGIELVGTMPYAEYERYISNKEEF